MEKLKKPAALALLVLMPVGYVYARPKIYWAVNEYLREGDSLVTQEDVKRFKKEAMLKKRDEKMGAGVNKDKEE